MANELFTTRWTRTAPSAVGADPDTDTDGTDKENDADGSDTDADGSDTDTDGTDGT